MGTYSAHGVSGINHPACQATLHLDPSQRIDSAFASEGLQQSVKNQKGANCNSCLASIVGCIRRRPLSRATLDAVGAGEVVQRRPSNVYFIAADGQNPRQTSVMDDAL